MDDRLEQDPPLRRQGVTTRKFAAMCEQHYSDAYPMLAPAAATHVGREDEVDDFDEQILAGLVNV